MGHLVSLDFLDHENIERVTAPNDHQNESTMPRQPKRFYFMCWKNSQHDVQPAARI